MNSSLSLSSWHEAKLASALNATSVTTKACLVTLVLLDDSDDDDDMVEKGFLIPFDRRTFSSTKHA